LGERHKRTGPSGPVLPDVLRSLASGFLYRGFAALKASISEKSSAGVRPTFFTMGGLFLGPGSLLTGRRLAQGAVLRCSWHACVGLPIIAMSSFLRGLGEDPDYIKGFGVHGTHLFPWISAMRMENPGHCSAACFSRRLVCSLCSLRLHLSTWSGVLSIPTKMLPH